jgi:hypothetical protein
LLKAAFLNRHGFAKAAFFKYITIISGFPVCAPRAAQQFKVSEEDNRNGINGRKEAVL